MQQRLAGFGLSTLGLLLVGAIASQTAGLWTVGVAQISLEALLWEGAGAALLMLCGFALLVMGFHDWDEGRDTFLGDQEQSWGK